jgi:exosortase family protein XrtG
MTVVEAILWVVAIAAWVAALWFLRSGRIWLPYYLVGAVGFAVGLVLLGHGPLGLERLLAIGTARGASVAASMIGIQTRLFSGAADSILVLVVRQPVGWTLLTVGIECSGLLEGATIAGLTLFYPLLKPVRRAWLVLAGLVATAAANIVRVLVIIATLHWGGKDALFVAHSIVGRGIFFALVVVIYWLAMTTPTLRQLRRKAVEPVGTGVRA